LQQGQSTVTKFASGIERAAQGGRSALYGLMKLNPGTYLAGATALLGAAIVKSIASFAQFADQIQKNADAVGVDAEAFQRLQHAANKTGVQAQNVMNIMTRFTSKLEEARGGNMKLIESFDKLGLSIYSLSKKTPDEALNAMLSRLREMKQAGQDVNGIIEDLFGKKSVQDINKMIAGNFESEQGNARIIDEELIKQSTELVNVWTELKNVVTVVIGQFLSWVGAMDMLRDAIDRLMPEKEEDLDVDNRSFWQKTKDFFTFDDSRNSTRQRTEYDRASELNEYNRDLIKKEEELKKKYSMDEVRARLSSTNMTGREITDNEVAVKRQHLIDDELEKYKNEQAKKIDDYYVHEAYMNADLRTDSEKQAEWFRKNVKQKHKLDADALYETPEEKKEKSEAEIAETSRQNRLYGYRKYNDVNGAILDQKNQAEIDRANKNLDLADQRASYAQFIQETGGVDENGNKIEFEEYLKLLENSVDVEEKRRKIKEQIDKLDANSKDYAEQKSKLEKELLETEDDLYYSNKRKELERKKKLRDAQNKVKQTELVESLEYSSKPPMTTEQAMNQAAATAIQNAQKQNIGLNDMQLERIGDVAKMDYILKNASLFEPRKIIYGCIFQ
jgi:hypothetical protein